MKSLVCIPTYNECENILPIIESVLLENPETNILVIDDNSPDGTGTLVQNLMLTNKSVNLLARPGKQGLGKAYLAGFEWGLQNSYDVIVEMDADFSHRSVDLKKILQATLTNDFVIGSRYVPGGSTVNWGYVRKLISRGGSLYSRLILGYPVNDWTGGFNAWTRKVLEQIDLKKVASEGYSFQIELKYRACKKNFHFKEVPIVFEDRRVGQSKMKAQIVVEALWRVWTMRFKI
jgi:dolichol-phosphate mannosyltransferase